LEAKKAALAASKNYKRFVITNLSIVLIFIYIAYLTSDIYFKYAALLSIFKSTKSTSEFV